MMNKKVACGISIGGIHTDVVVQVYSNRVLVIASQFQKLGSMIAVNRDSSLTGQFFTDVYSTKILFGKDDEETHAAVRFIAEKINVDRPLLISICLKDYSKATLDAIVTAIKQIKTW